MWLGPNAVKSLKLQRFDDRFYASIIYGLTASIYRRVWHPLRKAFELLLECFAQGVHLRAYGGCLDTMWG